MSQCQRRPFIIFLLLALSLLPIFAQQYVQIVDKMPTADQSPVGYYIIKLKYLSVEQVAACFKAGGAYARYIPSTVVSIAGMPKLQSIAIKTTDPQDVLTMTHLIMQIDRPARSYELTCTLVVTTENTPALLPDNFAQLSGAALNAKLRALVGQQRASVITYPNLHIDLNGNGDLAAQQSSAYYQLASDGIVILPAQLFPAMPTFRLSHIPPAANAPTTGQFGFVRMPEGTLGERTEYTLEKSVVDGAVVFSYTGVVPAEGTSYRIYLRVTLRAT